MSGSNVDIFIKDYINLNQKNVMYNSDEDDSRRNYRIPESKSQKAVRTIFGIVMILMVSGEPTGNTKVSIPVCKFNDPSYDIQKSFDNYRYSISLDADRMS